MRAFISVMAAALVAIGIGVGALAEFHSSATGIVIPPALETAINRTLELHNYVLYEGSGSGPIAEIIVQAPNRQEAIYSSAPIVAGAHSPKVLDDRLIGTTTYDLVQVHPSMWWGRPDQKPQPNFLDGVQVNILDHARTLQTLGSSNYLFSNFSGVADIKMLTVSINIGRGYVRSLTFKGVEQVPVAGHTSRSPISTNFTVSHIDNAPPVIEPTSGKVLKCPNGFIAYDAAGLAHCTPPNAGPLHIAPGSGSVTALGQTPTPLTVTYESTAPEPKFILEKDAHILTKRLRSLGATNPVVAPAGRALVAHLEATPKIRDELQFVGAPGEFEIRPVLCGAPAFSSSSQGSGQKVAPPTCPGKFRYSSSMHDMNSQSFNPGPYATDPSYAQYPSTSASAERTGANVLLPVPAGSSFAPRYLLGPVEFSGANIKDAYAQQTQSEGWVVVFDLTASGSKAFNRVAAQNYQSMIANELDGTILAAPVIESQVFPGSGQISGSFTQQSAAGLAAELNSGPLPIRLVLTKISA